MNLEKVIKFLLLLFLFLLPWQTRWIYHIGVLNGGFWEYGTFSWYGTEILLWIIIILFAIDRFRHKELWQRILTKEHFKKRKNILLYCFIVILFFGFEVFRSLSPEISYNFVFHIIEGACLAVVIASVARSHPALPSVEGRELDSPSFAKEGAGGGLVGMPFAKIHFAFAFWLGGVEQGIIAIGQFFSQHIAPNKWLGLAFHSPTQLGDFVVEAASGRWLRAYGSFGSPNILGGFLAVCLVVGLSLPLLRRGGGRGRTRWLNLGLIFGQLAILSGLILSFSRGAWIAVTAGVVVLLCVVARSFKGTTALKLVSKQILYSLFFILSFFITLHPLFTARITGTGRLEAKSIETRVSQYHEWQAVVSHNWLWGVGPGVYTQALWQLDNNRPVWQYQPIHNSYLLILAEIGVVGSALVFLFSCFLVFLIKKINPLYLAVLATLFIGALFDHWYWSMYFGQIIWWTVLGLGLMQTKIALE